MKRSIPHSLLFFVLALYVFPAIASAQDVVPATSLPFALKSLGHNVYAAIDNAKDEAGANAGFVIGSDGVLVIDTFQYEAAAKQLLAEIRKLTPLPIKFVVNTHYHYDHVTGNAVFEKAGAVVMAQRNVAHWIHTENLKFFGNDIKPEQKSLVESLVTPKLRYDSDITVLLGTREILVHVFPGHTGGDSVVMIPDAKVVFCGDLFWHQTLPNLIDASTEKWMETLEDLQTPVPSAQVMYVPGHGDPGDFHDVETFRGYLADVRSWVRKQMKEGKSADGLVETVLPVMKEKYGKWNFFEDFAKSNIKDTEAELRKTKRIPQPAVAGSDEK
jgi:glyoxylase-like metal-dependent hydrolase (beta-lactamase superfamily II)